jgi:carboxymethylenebutenolidase
MMSIRHHIGETRMAGFIELTAADGHKLAAWTDRPTGDGPGLVVVQEIFGVNNHIRNICRAFAAAGYSVIAPAMFDRAVRGVELGYTPDDIAKGRDLRGKVPDAGIIHDIEAAAAALGPRKMGIVGYCFGGTVAWWGATRSRRFSAASGWYGGGVAATRSETPNCAVQLAFRREGHGHPDVRCRGGEGGAARGPRCMCISAPSAASPATSAAASARPTRRWRRRGRWSSLGGICAKAIKYPPGRR